MRQKTEEDIIEGEGGFGIMNKFQKKESFLEENKLQ